MGLGYLIQSGPLKNVGLMALKSIYRNDFPAGVIFRDENRTRFLILYLSGNAVDAEEGNQVASL